ncbi:MULTISPECIES: acyl-homoserine-lactone synthase [unclassified Mesorhizobium]|uniref:acyl-homoserine-lactone synthase n=2 Tax=Mesorhizobium TaxID=68287 RepID=UPI000FDB5DDD|nr:MULTISPECIES: acyl-homoserine-lactone synthase [unclassified Mesorhizobium]TGQ04832.1 GNAT family N-acetyltransferase [Mesorhizobium sp. M2E.F.Ca.ET.219.01.1.1]TGS14395.1 GNAT family N-acetyltransferase [Mesorhizobium sp. M2E.F.Ca.ET.209.01.1.1]TGT65458.1 GNAT family N-acetyltransferase [Mesorhizobium sp. M2E.F.Ca.ET.166.01.1.1]TGV97504.1 GNAT family N-acetyltransferase [Mesorhizobium sp. M2E.F.Ca.ET.154.01.1.1]
MIRLITGSADPRHQDLLEEHYRLRHDIFVGERGWAALARPDGREVDGYDTPEAVYVLALEDDHVVGGYRFLPTSAPHLLQDRYSHLVDGPVPHGREIHEWSRFFIRRDRRGGKLFRQLMSSVPSVCRLLGISRLTSVIEPDWLTRFDAASFRYGLLGSFVQVAGMQLAAVQIDIEQAPEPGHAIGWNTTI